MQPIKIAGITAAALLAGGIFAVVHNAGARNRRKFQPTRFINRPI
jgi:hypothetical protein